MNTFEAQAEYDGLQKRIDSAETRIKDINLLQRHIGAYHKNRDVYSQYLCAKRNPQFRLDNEKAIATVEEAKIFYVAAVLFLFRKRSDAGQTEQHDGFMGVQNP